jgi:hypothetical protein
MIGAIGEPEDGKHLAKNFVAALFECLLEAVELIPSACATLLFVGASGCLAHKDTQSCWLCLLQKCELAL